LADFFNLHSRSGLGRGLIWGYEDMNREEIGFLR